MSGFRFFFIKILSISFEILSLVSKKSFFNLLSSFFSFLSISSILATNSSGATTGVVSIDMEVEKKEKGGRERGRKEGKKEGRERGRKEEERGRKEEDRE